jgi:hypothetical protein
MAFRQESPIKEHSKSGLNKNKEKNNINQELPVKESAYLQINRTMINVLNMNVLQTNGSPHQQKFVEV